MRRAILFDFGGTLDYPRHWLDRLLTHYRAAGLGLTRNQLDLSFVYATEVAYRASAELRHYSLTDLVRYLVTLQMEHLRSAGTDAARAVFHSVSDHSSVAERITQAFVAESRAGLAASATLLSRLAPDFKLGVVSNFYGNLDYVLNEGGLAQWLGTIADSSRIGLFKPSLGLFQAALDGLGVEPRATAMVGDSLTKDCAPARRLGLTTIWLKHREALPASDAGAAGEVADFTIASLAELPGLRW